MAGWGIVAGVYGAVLAVAAISAPGLRRRPVVLVACAAYALVAVGAASFTTSAAVQLLVPGGLLLGGYWLSGFFFRDPQRWLEQWLLDCDRRLFTRLRANAWLARAPRWVLELLEAAYAADYIVVGGGALLVAPAGAQAIATYWTIVLAAELPCYVTLPWMRSRPPRAIEAEGVMARRGLSLRRLNTRILDSASVQANTIPSGHVAGALAASIAVFPVNPAAGVVFGVMTVLIALAAVAGRYHYAVDCVAAAVLATAVALVV